MLAKLWKKVLLAICIVACLFNIMSKLVNRTSLELNLKQAANQGTSIFSEYMNQSNENNVKQDTIDGVVIQNTQTDNSENSTIEESQTNNEENEKESDLVVIY